MNQFKIKKDNEVLAYKLKRISEKEAKPKMNNGFLDVDAKKKVFNNKLRRIEKENIERENGLFNKRLNGVKSCFSVKKWDKEYFTDHQRMLKKLKKIHEGDVLPTISDKEVMESFKCRTEANKKETDTESDEEKKEKKEEEEGEKKEEREEGNNEEKKEDEADEI
ncbi:MAG: hypothetical protein MJ252_10480 [archaeon]|nr:hypothetical protein [archaeon]